MQRIFLALWIIFIFSSATPAGAQAAPASLPQELVQLRQEIEKERPLDFAFLRPPNPWFHHANVNFFSGEFHRLFVHTVPEKNSLEAAILAHVNDPKNQKFLLLRRYLARVRREYLKSKPAGDPYAAIKPEDPVYIVHADIFNQTGPMTHINIANLLLPEEWAQKNYQAATPADGKVIYAYVFLTDTPERSMQELWQERELFDHFFIHLCLRLMEAEARGQSWGLEAHMGAHTGPAVNLAFGTTWCQNRGFYESWPLAHRALLSQLFPKAFPEPRWQALRLRDRFLYFSADPWQEGFEPLLTDRQSWNTPQAVLSSNYANAAFQFRAWHDASLAQAWHKSIAVLSSHGSANLRAFLQDWKKDYPQDATTLGKNLRLATRDLTLPKSKATAEHTPASEFFTCMGPSIWVGIPPGFDHVDFNASSADEVKTMISRLAYRMPSKDFKVWILGPSPDTQPPQNMIALLADEMDAYRAQHCGQFQNFNEIKTFISSFAERHALPRRAAVLMIKSLDQGKVDLEHFYEDEKTRLIKIGAYRPRQAAAETLAEKSNGLRLGKR